MIQGCAVDLVERYLIWAMVDCCRDDDRGKDAYDCFNDDDGVRNPIGRSSNTVVGSRSCAEVRIYSGVIVKDGDDIGHDVDMGSIDNDAR